MTPPYGLTLNARVIDNYDGDSLTIEAVQKAKIRITDEEGKFDTPEIGWRANSDAERYLGELAREAVKEFCKNPVKVHISAGALGIMGDSAAVGNRYAARIWNDEGVELADYIKNLELTKWHAAILALMDIWCNVITYTSHEEHIKKAPDESIIYLPSIFKKSIQIYQENIIYLNSINVNGNFYNYLDQQLNFNGQNICFISCKNPNHSYIGVF